MSDPAMPDPAMPDPAMSDPAMPDPAMPDPPTAGQSITPVPITPVPIPPSTADRVLAVIDRLRHPFLVHELSTATRGFRAIGVIRRYDNDSAGRGLEMREGPILWHRGYRPPPRLTHNAIWNTGGPVVTVGYSREVRPAVLGERGRAFEERMGIRR